MPGWKRRRWGAANEGQETGHHIIDAMRGYAETTSRHPRKFGATRRTGSVCKILTNQGVEEQNRVRLPIKKIADKIKLTHLALVETKTVGNGDLRDRERNGAVAPRLMFLAEPGLFYRRMQGAEWGACLRRSDLGFAAGFLG